MYRVIAVGLTLLLLGACTADTGEPEATPLAIPAPAFREPDWREAITAEDRDRLAQLEQIWAAALDSVPQRDRRLVAREGELLVADAARAHPDTPPGSYNCRLVKLGRRPGRGAVQAFPDFFCYIRAESGNRLSFTKQTGSELPGGWLHPAGDRRIVLLGASQRSPGDNSVAYGDDRERDLVGIVERIGPFRWRLVLPWRGDAPGIDVYELTPVPLDQQAPEPDDPDEAEPTEE